MTYLATLTRLRFVLLMSAIMLFGLLAAPMVAQGQCDQASDPFCLDDVGTGSGLGQENLQTTVAKIINVALSLLGIVAVVIILIGGFKWMTAGGNDDKVGEARKLIFAGIIGLAIILSAFAIASFVLTQLGTATGTVGAENY